MSKNHKQEKAEEKIDPVLDQAAAIKNENCCEECGCHNGEEAFSSCERAELLEKLKEAEARRDDYLLTAQRVQAEFENFKRRTASARGEGFDDGERQLALDIVPVLDNFERALSAAGPLKTGASDEARLFCEGVEMVAKQLFEALAKHGMELIDPHGEEFDPELHNAAMQTPAEDGQTPGSIVEVFQKGYRIKGKMIRYAMVRVAGE